MLKASKSSVRAAWGASALVVATLALGCRRPQGTVNVACSTAMQGLVEALSDAYMQAHPERPIIANRVDSASAVFALREGIAGLAIVDYVSLPPEARSLWNRELARDAIAVIVHPANPVAGLTSVEVKAAFSGSLRRWKDVGGADHEINVVVREEGSGTRQSFEQLLNGLDGNRGAVIQDTSLAVMETVAQDPNAIGYVSRAVVDSRVRALAVDGVACEAGTVADGRYRLSRSVFLLTREPPSGGVRDFVDFVSSPRGREIIAAAGLLPPR